MTFMIHATITVLAVALLGPPICYALGLSFSRGYHKGKREHVALLMKEATDGTGP